MKIKETIERECCQSQDLKPYKGDKSFNPQFKFCVHCGQKFELTRKYNGYDYDHGYFPIDEHGRIIGEGP